MTGRTGRTHVYVSGPMRGIAAFNFPAFFAAEKVAEEFWGAHTIVCNPARMDTERFGLDHLDPATAGETLMETPDLFGPKELRDALAHDMEFICSLADVVVVLPGWEASKGAQAEVATAKALGLPVLRVEDISEQMEVDWVFPDELVANSIKAEDIQTATTLEVVNAFGDRIATFSAPGEEVRVTSATGGQKGTKLAAFDQISPEVEKLVAEHFGKGARKYAAHNFRKGYAWSLSYSALRRHLADFWSGKEYDVCPEDGRGCLIKHPETGEDTRMESEHGWTCYNHTGSLHIVAVIWHAMVLTEFFLHRKEYDDRYVYPSN